MVTEIEEIKTKIAGLKEVFESLEKVFTVTLGQAFTAEGKLYPKNIEYYNIKPTKSDFSHWKSLCGEGKKIIAKILDLNEQRKFLWESDIEALSKLGHTFDKIPEMIVWVKSCFLDDGSPNMQYIEGASSEIIANFNISKKIIEKGKEAMGELHRILEN